jgi:hypothetical protein
VQGEQEGQVLQVQVEVLEQREERGLEERQEEKVQLEAWVQGVQRVQQEQQVEMELGEHLQ